jgi:hypothetical protein
MRDHMRIFGKKGVDWYLIIIVLVLLLVLAYLLYKNGVLPALLGIKNANASTVGQMAQP